MGQELEEYEKAQGFVPKWVNTKKAYKTNMETINSGKETTGGIRRETKVLEIIMGNIK